MRKTAPVRVLERQDVREDTPIRLETAARLAFPDGSVSHTGLRREVAKGRLKAWKIAGKNMTSLAEVGKMVELCRVPSSQDFGFVPPPETARQRGSSSTEESNTALAAARMRIQKLRQSLQKDDKK